MFDRGAPVYPVTEIEDMRAICKGFEDQPDAWLQPIAAGEQQQRIEIALHGHAGG